MTGPAVFIVFGAAVWPDGSPSGAMRRRTLGALEQAEGISPRIFLVTGGQGRYGQPEALVMRQLLLDAGVADSEIRLEDQARDTLESVLLCRRILAQPEFAGARPVAVSSGYHVPRCRLLFRLMGVRAAPGPIARDRAVIGGRSWLYAVMRECAATPWDALLICLWHRWRWPSR